MKKIIPTLVLSLIIIFKVSIAETTTVAPIYSSNPKMFVQELISDAISKLSDKNLTKEEKANYVEIIAINMKIEPSKVNKKNLKAE